MKHILLFEEYTQKGYMVSVGGDYENAANYTAPKYKDVFKFLRMELKLKNLNFPSETELNDIITDRGSWIGYDKGMRIKITFR